MKKLSNTDAQLKKSVAYQESVYFDKREKSFVQANCLH